MNIFRNIIIVIGLVIILKAGIALAATTGTIDSTYKYAGIAVDSSLINFGCTNCNVSITNTAMTGYAWAENWGWINLSPTSGGVTNDSGGNLGGYAWGQNTGWINFAPTNGGVTIDESSNFQGYAWGESVGWINFNCISNSVCYGLAPFKVKTDWTQIQFQPECDNGIDDDNDGAIDFPTDQGCTSATDNDEGGPYAPPPPPGDGGGKGPTEDPIDPPEPVLCLEGFVLNEQGECVEIIILPPPEPVLCPEGTFLNDNSECEEEEKKEEEGELPPPDPGDIGGGVDPIEPPAPIEPPEGPIEPIEPPEGETPPSEPAELLPLLPSEIIDAINTPEGEIATKTIATVGLVSGATAVAASALILNPVTLTEILLTPLRFWTLFLGIFGVRKRRKPWGTVYDSETKQPLDPAYVVLQDAQGNEINTSITDLDGRYGFLSNLGSYTIVANKTNYEFPSKKLAGRISDELYQDLYFGESLLIRQEGEVITKNIPLDPVGFDWNEFAKREKNLMRFHRQRNLWFKQISNALFVIGFIIALIALAAAPQPYNFIIFGLYIILLILRQTVLKPKPQGDVTELATGNPLSYAIVRAFSAATDNEVGHAVVNGIGKYYLLIPNGNYYLRIDKKNDDGSYSTVKTTERFEVVKGYIKKDLKI